MPEIGVNFEQVAEEYSDIPESIRSLNENMDGFIKSVESNLVGTGLSGAEETVSSYSEFERAVEEFEREVTYLMGILRSNTTPDSVNEIEEIETACDQLCSASEELQSNCFQLSESLTQAGATDVAEDVQTLAVELGAITPSVQQSFFDNQLLTAVKAYHFPSSVAEDVPKVIDALDHEDLERRQNSYFVLMMAAQEEPAAVAPYATQIASNLSAVSSGEQQNLLGVLNILQSQDEAQDIDVQSDALNLVDAADPTVALYASLLLAKQATTAEQAQVMAARIKSLLIQEIGTEGRTNATFVLYKLAQSHPEAVEGVTPTVAKFLTTEPPSVQENVVEFLGEIGATEYAEKIQTVQANSKDEEVISAADVALEKLPKEAEVESKNTLRKNSSQDNDSIIAEIEDAFEEL